VRTNIEIDSELMEKALRLSGLRTKREVVEKALNTLVRLEEQQKLRELRGKLVWDDDLDRMRGAE
jgi:Arc/MetJ family transcription regulator